MHVKIVFNGGNAWLLRQSVICYPNIFTAIRLLPRERTMRKTLPILIALCLLPGTLPAADNQKDAITGWSIGGVPAVGYKSDTGYQYGLVLNLYQYGDGSQYPDYLYSLYGEWSRTTKGSGINKLFFDSKYLLPHDIRVTSELSYLTEQSLPFYGFNGYLSDYTPALEDQETPPDSSTRVYYRHERRVTKFTADFQGNLPVRNLRWFGGLALWHTDVAPVDISDLNEGRDEGDRIRDELTLYERYVRGGYITEQESKGGYTNFLKLGLVYDSRDNEPNPMSGLWTEALLTLLPDAMGNDFSYTMLTVTHRQYFTLIPGDLSFAYRLGYQDIIGGNAPFFMLPFYQSSYKTEEGLGGSKSLRGILKNRIVGNAVAFGNFELRWKFYRFTLANQHFYFALNGFIDAGTVLENYGTEAYFSDIEDTGENRIHPSYGGGFRIAMNQNFIVAVDYGLAADPQDGDQGLYIGLGYLY